MYAKVWSNACLGLGPGASVCRFIWKKTVWIVRRLGFARLCILIEFFFFFPPEQKWWRRHACNRAPVQGIDERHIWMRKPATNQFVKERKTPTFRFVINLFVGWLSVFVLKYLWSHKWKPTNRQPSGVRVCVCMWTAGTPLLTYMNCSGGWVIGGSHRPDPSS